MMNESTDILRFHDVTIAPDSDHESGISSLNLSLAPGDLTVVSWENEENCIVLSGTH